MKDQQVCTRLSGELKKKLEEQAKNSGWTTSNYIEKILSKWVKETEENNYSTIEIIQKLLPPLNRKNQKRQFANNFLCKCRFFCVYNPASKQSHPQFSIVASLATPQR